MASDVACLSGDHPQRNVPWPSKPCLAVPASSGGSGEESSKLNPSSVKAFQLQSGKTLGMGNALDSRLQVLHSPSALEIIHLST